MTRDGKTHGRFGIMRIYIIRHGETPANEKQLLQGWTDNPLNESGIKLAELTGRAMRGIRFDAVYSSPLIRARQTADIVLHESGNGGLPVTEDARIKEIFVGDWEDYPFDLAKMPEDDGTGFGREQARRYLTDTIHFEGFPGGESIRAVCDRTQDFLRGLAKKEHKCVLVSTHGCAVRAMLNFLYEDPSSFWQQGVPLNCAVNIVEAENGVLRLAERDKIYYDPALCVDRYSMK